MSKKLEKNGLWESSRMMLPEHKARIQESNLLLEKKEKPILDSSKWDEIDERISNAYNDGAEISLLLYGAYENRIITGIITKVDVLTHKIMVGGEWFRPSNILDVY